MAESTFGREACGDWKLINDLRGKGRAKPRRLWPETEDAIRTFMRDWRDIPAPGNEAADASTSAAA